MNNASGRVRRVGTFTLGITLVVAGVISVIHTLNPEFDIVKLLSFSPAVLIALGVEVLIASFVNDSEKIKYDAVSIFLCILLICGSIGVSVTISALEYFTPAHQSEINRIEYGLRNESYTLLKNNPDISALDVVLIRDTFDVIDADSALADIHINLKNAYSDTELFAAECRTICDLLFPVTDKFKNIHIYSEDMSVHLDGRFQHNFTVGDIESIVNG